MKVKSESEVSQSCPTLRDPMDCSPPGSSVHGIFQTRVLECGAIAFSAMNMSLHQFQGMGKDMEAWRAAVYGVANNQTLLRDRTNERPEGSTVGRLLGCNFSAPSAPNSGEPETARAGGTEGSQGRETVRCPPQPAGVPAKGSWIRAGLL